MTIDIIVFEEAGTIEVESGEEYNVSVGAVKFNVEIKDYSFCNPCRKGNKDYVGEFIDLTMEIKGTKGGKPTKSKKQKGGKGKSKAKKQPETYNLGDSEVIISSLVNVDGVWVNMTDDYPMIEHKGSKNLFTFRFPKFTNSVYYDPIGQAATEEETDNTTTTTTTMTPPTSENKTLSVGTISIEVTGKSGKIAVKNDGKKIMQISPDHLEEKTAADEKAGNHELTNFAKTDFEFSPMMETQKYGLNATTINFKTNFTKDIEGQMTIDMIFFTEAGTIEVESGEEYNISVGAVKFNVEIENYQFCNPCKKGNKDLVGAFLDLTMEIKGTKEGKPEKSSKQKGGKGKSKAKKQPETYDLGESEVIVSSLVKVDGTWANMTDGYPKIEVKGSKTLFTFRFPKFTTSVYYDPIGQESDTGPTQPPTTTKKSAGSNIYPQALFVAILSVLTMFFRM